MIRNTLGDRICSIRPGLESMPLVRLSVALLAIVVAGWLTFDGTRAFVRGDYITARTGAHAGQLGPWAQVLSAVGVAPRATATKLGLALYGASWLTLTVAFLAGVRGTSLAMLIAAAGVLWYAPVGTVLAALQIALLIWMRRVS